MRVVVSDTSPLTALLQIGRAELLPALFEEIFVPAAVHEELSRSHDSLPVWLKVQAPRHIPPRVAAANLDPGETEAIALCFEVHADLLLIDESDARAVAIAEGIRITGVLGLLVIAKERGLISAVLPVIDQLRNHAGCWFADHL